ncbi:MAG TPA: DUF423 domain-containing protein [Chthonomonadaceae bacterium]|nr:DUF423 domain-containing protein [Chthonomonadaceae bacterium]
MMRLWILLGGINAFLAVALGAFGAHSLKARLVQTGQTEVYQTGAHYHLIHALALLLIAILAERWRSPLVEWSGWLLFAGIVLFSGSLYALAISGVRPLGAITPLGGLCFLAGWALLVVAALKEPH